MKSQFFSEDKDKHDGHVSRVFAACFHPRNNYELITGGWDDVVQFWDLRQPYATRHLSEIHMCGEGLDINKKGTEVSVNRKHLNINKTNQTRLNFFSCVNAL